MGEKYYRDRVNAEQSKAKTQGVKQQKGVKHQKGKHHSPKHGHKSGPPGRNGWPKIQKKRFAFEDDPGQYGFNATPQDMNDCYDPSRAVNFVPPQRQYDVNSQVNSSWSVDNNGAGKNVQKFKNGHPMKQW